MNVKQCRSKSASWLHPLMKPGNLDLLCFKGGYIILKIVMCTVQLIDYL